MNFSICQCTKTDNIIAENEEEEKRLPETEWESKGNPICKEEIYWNLIKGKKKGLLEPE